MEYDLKNECGGFMRAKFPLWRSKNLLGLLGGFVTILGFLLPFNWGRSLFTMMDGTTLPFLPQLLLLSVVVAIILYSLDFNFIPNLIGMILLSLLFLLYFSLLHSFPIPILIKNLQIGAYILPLGLFTMVSHSLFSPKWK